MSSSKSYRPWTPDEVFLLPPSPREWLPEGHLAFFILDMVALLDLSAVEDALQAKDARGVRPYDPAMMVALLLYAYCTGTYSSRRIERATYDHVAFRVLAGQRHPDHPGSAHSARRISRRSSRMAGMVKLGRLARSKRRRSPHARPTTRARRSTALPGNGVVQPWFGSMPARRRL